MTKEVEIATARASPENSSVSRNLPSPKVITPTSNPLRGSPTNALPQYLQQQTLKHSTNVMVNTTQQNQTSLPLVPGLDVSNNEAPIQSPSLTADGSSSIGTNSSSAIASASKEGVMLGLQALERQQEESERRRSALETTVPRDNPFDASPRRLRMKRKKKQPQDVTYKDGVPSSIQLNDEEERSMSSIHRDNTSSDLKAKKMTRVDSFGKFLRTPLKHTQNLRRSISNRLKEKSNKETESVKRDENEPPPSDSSATYNKPIISGYLNKRAREGKWQRRWFESDGKNLLYFKSDKRVKLLATLDLLYIGGVAMDQTDPTGCTFYIEVAGRDYYLHADSRDHALDWVISMNRVREARMEIGGLKLVEPVEEDSEALVDDYAPRVVMVATRNRAKGLRREDFDSPVDGISSSAVIGTTFTEALSPSGTGSMISSSASLRLRRRKGALVRWEKRRSNFQNLTRRLSRWAKRLTMLRCVIRDEPQKRNGDANKKLSKKGNSKSNISKPENPFGEGMGGSGFEIAADPSNPFAHYQGLDPEGRTLDQISETDPPISTTPLSQVDKKTKTSWTDRVKGTKRASRKKHEDAPSLENSAGGDVDSSSGRESTNSNKKDDESSCVV